MANWYAVYTRPRWEKKVSETLTKKRIENYCPVTRVPAQWSERRKGIYQPLFASYVFVRATSAEFEIIKRTDGVINLLYWMGKPAVIRDIEIEMIKRFLAEHSQVAVEKGQVNVTEIVRIVKSVASDGENKVFDLHNRRIKLVLPSLGFHLVAEIPTEEIELVLPPEALPMEATLAKIG